MMFREMFLLFAADQGAIVSSKSQEGRQDDFEKFLFCEPICGVLLRLSHYHRILMVHCGQNHHLFGPFRVLHRSLSYV